MGIKGTDEERPDSFDGRQIAPDVHYVCGIRFFPLRRSLLFLSSFSASQLLFQGKKASAKKTEREQRRNFFLNECMIYIRGGKAVLGMFEKRTV